MRSSPTVVDLEQLEGLAGDVERDGAGMAHLGDVADAPENPVRHARRAASAAGDLLARGVLDLDAENAGRAADDRRELSRLVVAEPEGHPEAVSERRRQEAGSGGRADERERRQIERQRAGARTLADDDVEPEVLERRVQDLLDRPVHAVDLVDEEDVAGLQAGEDRGHVSLALERRAGDRADADAELLADDRREGRLAEAGRADEQDVVERVSPARAASSAISSCSFVRSWPTKSSSRRGRSDCSTSSSPSCSTGARNCDRHAALRSASRTRSSAERSGSVRASACSASMTE